MYGSTDRALERLEQDRNTLMTQQSTLTRDLQSMVTRKQTDQQKIEQSFVNKMKLLQVEKDRDTRRLQETADRAISELQKKLETIKQRLLLASQNIEQRTREVAREQQKKAIPASPSSNGRVSGDGLRR